MIKSACLAITILFVQVAMALSTPASVRYKFDEGTGSTIHDETANSVDGHTSGGPEWIAGVRGTALLFDGVDDRVKIEAPFLQAQTALSICLWYKQFQSGAFNQTLIFHQSGGAWRVSLIGESVVFGVCSTAGCTDCYASRSTDTLWHQVCCTWSKGLKIEVFLDGELAAECPIPDGDLLTGPYLPGIGASTEEFAPHYCSLILDEVAVFPTALSAEECFTEYKDMLSICGDADDNGLITISDAVYLLSYIFAGGPRPPSISAADVNLDGFTSVSDVVYLISYIFAGGSAPCLINRL